MSGITSGQRLCDCWEVHHNIGGIDGCQCDCHNPSNPKCGCACHDDPLNKTGGYLHDTQCCSLMNGTIVEQAKAGESWRRGYQRGIAEFREKAIADIEKLKIRPDNQFGITKEHEKYNQAIKAVLKYLQA